MLPIIPAGHPLSVAVAAQRNARQIEAAQKGTSLRDAITLERDKNQSRDNSRQHSDQSDVDDSEHTLHLYTSDGAEMDIVGATAEVDVIA